MGNMPPPQSIPSRTPLVPEPPRWYPQASIGGGRFSGPEVSPSICDAQIREASTNGYTTEHVDLVQLRDKLYKAAQNKVGGADVITLQLVLSYVPEGEINLAPIGVVSGPTEKCNRPLTCMKIANQFTGDGT